MSGNLTISELLNASAEVTQVHGRTRTLTSPRRRPVRGFAVGEPGKNLDSTRSSSLGSGRSLALRFGLLVCEIPCSAVYGAHFYAQNV